MSDKPREGWAWLSNSPKWHYFVAGRSLCGKWLMVSGDLEQGKDNSPDNCAICRRELKKRQAKATKEVPADV